MEPLAVVRRVSARSPNPRLARAWVRIDGRWRRCTARSIGLERDVVKWAGADGWLQCSPLPAVRATLSVLLADGSSVDLVAYPTVVTRIPIGYRIEAPDAAGGWQRIEEP